MLNLIEALKYCGFEEAAESFLNDTELWEGLAVADALGVTDDWSGWEGGVRTFWRTHGNSDCGIGEEVVICVDRIVIVDRTRRRYATTCRCEPEGCALAAELVRTWFAAG